MSLTLTTQEAELLADAFPKNSIATVEDINNGLNSNVKKIIFTNSENVILKEYREDPSRDRLLSEQLAMKYISTFAENKIADLLYSNLHKRLALLSFIEGQSNPEIRSTELRSFIDFQIGLDVHKASSEAANLYNAADACFCPNDLILQIRNRIARLLKLSPQLDDVDNLLRNIIIPKFKNCCKAIEETFFRLGIPLDRKIPDAWKTIICSDFGSHNSIKTPAGELMFIDFEYFGLDDPITGIANFSSHPNMNSTKKIQKNYEAEMLDYFSFIPHLSERYFSLKPLFILRWALIMLNSFAANENRGQLNQKGLSGLRIYQNNQLKKATNYLASK